MPLNTFGNSTTLQDVVRERRNDAFTIAFLEKNKLPGRIRTGFRTAPSSNSDVIAGDAEGDFITDATYTYTLITVSGALKWNRIAHSVGW